jgi:hypothetical protein
MKEIRFLTPKPFIVRKVFGFSDVMVGTDENEMVRIIEKLANGGDFLIAGMLACPEGIEADHNERIHPFQDRTIERNLAAIVTHALELEDTMAGLSIHLLSERGEVGFHNVIQEAGDALIKNAWI